MAKKKTVKTKKKTSKLNPNGTAPMPTFPNEVYNQNNQVDFLAMFGKINSRIDRIVEAIDKSKSVRGL
jgi:hypothetical protein